MAREKAQKAPQRKRPGGPAGPIRRRNCYFCKEKIADEVVRFLAVRRVQTKRDADREPEYATTNTRSSEEEE